MAPSELETLTLVIECDTSTSLDLTYVKSKIDGAVLHSGNVVMEWEESQRKIVVLISASGKLICAGSNTDAMARGAVARVVEMLRDIGYDGACVTNYRIRKQVRATELGFKLDLLALASIYPEFVSHDPTRFHGAIAHYPGDSRMTVMIFDSGRLVIVGGNSVSNTNAALDWVLPLLSIFDGAAIGTPAAPKSCA